MFGTICETARFTQSTDDSRKRSIVTFSRAFIVKFVISSLPQTEIPSTRVTASRASPKCMDGGTSEGGQTKNNFAGSA
jgi:hypothetical protein